MATQRSTPGPVLIYLSVFVGGVLGGAARYALSLTWPTQPGRIPWAILLVNLAGAFVLAWLLGRWIMRHGHAAHPWRPFLATGGLGAFTTWSTFISDVRLLWVGGDPVLSGLYLVGSPIMGVLAASLGWGLALRRHGEVPAVGT